MLQTLESIENLQLDGHDDRLEFAHKIALDLYHFSASFSQTSQAGDMLIIPTNYLDRWMERFNRKYAVDPNFMMKN
jgi:hypothetical protein